MDEEDVEFRYMDPLTPDRLSQVVKAKTEIDGEDEVVVDMTGIVGIEDAMETDVNRVRGYVSVVMDFVVV